MIAMHAPRPPILAVPSMLFAAMLSAPWIGAAAQVAKNPSAAATPAMPLVPPAAPPLAPTAFGLLALLLLVPVGLWALRRFGARIGVGTGGLRIVAQLGLGPRERLVVVEAGERCLILGLSAAGIQRVGTIDRAAIQSPQPGPASFASLLRNRNRNDAQQ